MRITIKSIYFLALLLFLTFVSKFGFKMSSGATYTLDKHSTFEAQDETNCKRRQSSDGEAAVLNVVTWNVNLRRASYSAPPSWTQQYESSSISGDILMDNLIREEILSTTPPPDIIALQEMPTPFWGQLLFGGEHKKYVLVGVPRMSHSGYVCLLVRPELAELAVQIQGLPDNNPSAAIQLSVPMKGRDGDPKREVQVIIASSHLAPFQENGDARLSQMRELVKVCAHDGAERDRSLPDSVIFVGDMNMREEEDEDIESSTMVPLLDAWKEYGMDGKTFFSWDTFTNLYWPNGRKYRCRFDRVYYHTDEKSEYCMQVSDFDLIGDKPLLDHGGPHHFLCDHFGIYSQFTFTPNTHHETR